MTTPRNPSGTRILTLLLLLRQGKPATLAALAESLGVSERQAYRYIGQLRQRGVEVLHDDGQGYWMAGNPFLPPLDLTMDEVVALAALASAANRRGSLLGRRSFSAMRKLVSQLPPGLQGAMQGRTMDLRMPAGEAVSGDLLPVFEHAAAQGQELRCAYATSAGEIQHFLLDPYCVLWAERAWYVIGSRQKLDAKGVPQGPPEVRNLRASRFQEAALTGRQFLPPPGWTLRAHLGNAWRLMRGAPQQVVLRFDAGPFAATVAATQWHATQQAQTLPDGRLELRFSVDGLDEIEWWVLGYGPKVEVAAPPELKQRVAKLAREAAARHG